MQRYYSELHLIHRQRSVALRFGESLPAGAYRKRHALDCGHTRCGICHREKRFGHMRTRQELAAELRLREQSAE